MNADPRVRRRRLLLLLALCLVASAAGALARAALRGGRPAGPEPLAPAVLPLWHPDSPGAKAPLPETPAYVIRTVRVERGTPGELVLRCTADLDYAVGVHSCGVARVAVIGHPDWDCAVVDEPRGSPYPVNATLAFRVKLPGTPPPRIDLWVLSWADRDEFPQIAHAGSSRRARWGEQVLTVAPGAATGTAFPGGDPRGR